ncbi:MAG: leucine-rich repeat domain-containing protein [Candidatus Lokiarchaeia archaeon]
MIENRRFYLKQFRRAIRRYNGEKCFVENISNKSRLLEKIFGIDVFYSYLNSTYSFKKLIKAFSLKFLYLDLCQLESVPTEVFLCKNLEELSLSNNSLTYIPKEIYKLNHLKKLILSHNQISSLPDEIGTLKSLELLWVDDNQLTSLPRSLNYLKNLRDLDTSKNRLPKVEG